MKDDIMGELDDFMSQVDGGELVQMPGEDEFEGVVELVM